MYPVLVALKLLQTQDIFGAGCVFNPLEYHITQALSCILLALTHNNKMDDGVKYMED